MHNDRDEVKELLKTRIEDLCMQLLPDGRRQGRLWVSFNPVTADFDRSSPELKIGLTGDRGAWKDWRSGDKGDVIGLITYIKGLEFRDAMAWARQWLGLTTMGREERARLESQARVQKRASDEKAERDRLRKIERAGDLFLAGSALGTDSVAEAMARAYFEIRKCPLKAIGNLDRETFRFSAATEYWTRAEYRLENGQRRKIADGPRLPAIHAAFRGPAGQITAVHCTFLDPILPKKANLDGDGKFNAKLIYGEAKGAVIRIAHGPEGLPPEQATKAGPLVLCEGIETGLSLAVAIPEAAVWAGGSLSNMGNAPVWMGSVSHVFLARDNNEGNAQAEKQLDSVLAQLAAHGKPVTVMASILGDDFNDLTRGEG